MSELDNENPHSHAAAAAEISDDALEAALEVADPTRDINLPLEPPPAGVYPFVWGLNKNKKDGGAYFKQSDSGQWMLILSLIGKLQTEDEDFKDFLVNDNLNSYYRKGTTAIHHFMNCVGQPLPASTNLKQMRESSVEVLGTEPTGHAILEWKASIQKDGKWVTLASRMTDFPKDEETGKYQPWIETENDNGERVKVYAQAQIVAHVIPQQ